eukprot:7380376-Pyramimonas_sp.AAC.1
MALALIRTTQPVIDSILRGLKDNHCGGTRAHLVHMVIGDGVGTNVAADCRMLCYFRAALDDSTL